MHRISAPRCTSSGKYKHKHNLLYFRQTVAISSDQIKIMEGEKHASFQQFSPPKKTTRQCNKEAVNGPIKGFGSEQGVTDGCKLYFQIIILPASKNIQNHWKVFSSSTTRVNVHKLHPENVLEGLYHLELETRGVYGPNLIKSLCVEWICCILANLWVKLFQRGRGNLKNWDITE